MKYFFISVVLIFSGCVHQEYNLATGQEETLFYSEDKESRIGRRVAEKIEEEYPVVGDVDANERADNVLEKIIAVCDRKNLIYRISILDRKDSEDDEIINAVSLPGGYVYIFKDLMDKIETDDQLAAIISHEVAHIAAKHSLKRMQNVTGAVLLQVLAAAQTSARTAAGLDLALTSLFLDYAQQDEFQADELGLKYMTQAGFDPKGMTEMLEVLRAYDRKQPAQRFSYWRTHPYISQRIAKVKGAIKGEMEFKDYIHLIGSEP